MRHMFVVVVLLCSAPAFAQDREEHAWIDVDFAHFQSFQDEQAYGLTRTIFLETAAAAAAYPKLPGVGGLALSGGAYIGHSGLGVAARFNGVNYKSTVGMAVSIPSPYFFNNPGTDATVTAQPLNRQDRALDMSAVYTVPTANRLRVRIFGGPTYFKVTSSMIDNINYLQAASAIVRLNLVAISSHVDKEVSKSALGFNVGGDVAVFFSRYVGVGGTVRFNRGSATITEPLSGENADLKLGHAEFGGGLRLRF